MQFEESLKYSKDPHAKEAMEHAKIAIRHADEALRAAALVQKDEKK
ncbi:MAG: hypothetical protein HYS21_02080 [Deltaproteobacteria bacterium]|nr:hypothetical protein [Deltaproteobacteria bacterium]